MHITSWRSTIISWANALQLCPFVSFVTDLKQEFFSRLIQFLDKSKKNVYTIADAKHYVKKMYPKLVLGPDLDENDVTLLATAFLLVTSVHETNEDLCSRLCTLPGREQSTIKAVLEELMKIPGRELTKDAIYSALARLPEESELVTSPLRTPRNSSTPDIPTSNEGSSRRRSSRFKRLKHKYEMSIGLQQALTEDLEQARDTITSLEAELAAKSLELNKLKSRSKLCAVSKSSPQSQRNSMDVNAGDRECIKCKSLQKQLADASESYDQLYADFGAISESSKSLSEKLKTLENEKRLEFLKVCELMEQHERMEELVSCLQQEKSDLLEQRKELESIIEELKPPSKVVDLSDEFEATLNFPGSLANEVVDLQIAELRNEIKSKDELVSKLLLDLTSESSEKKAIQHDLVNARNVIDQNDLKILSLVSEVEDFKSLELQLRGDLAENRQVIQTLETQMSMLDKLCQETSSKLTVANQEVTELKEQATNTQKLVLELREALAQEYDHQKGLQKGLSDAQATIAEKERDIAELIVKTDLLESQKSKMEAEAAEKQTAIQKLEIELGNTKVSLDASQLQLTQAREEISALGKRANDSDELAHNLNDKLMALSEIKTSLEHELSNSLKVLDQKETMLGEANNKIEELHSVKRNLEADMTKKQETIQELGVKIINLESALQNATCELSEARQELSNLNQQVANSNVIIQDLRGKLLEESDIKAALESKITDLIARIDKLESQKGRLEAEVAANLVRIKELATEFRETLAQEHEHQKGLQKGLSDAQAIIAEKERDMAELIVKTDLLESQKSKLEAEAAEKQTAIQKLEIELGNTKVSLDASQLQLTQAREEISALDKRANDSDESAHILNDKLMALSEIKTSLEHELSITLEVMDQKETMLRVANNEIEELHSGKRNLEVDLTKNEEIIQELGVEIINLKSVLQNATCDLSEAKQEISNLNEQVANSNVIIQHLRGKLLEESDMKAALNQELCQTQLALDEIESKVMDFIARIDKLESQKGRLEAEVVEKQVRIEELTTELGNAKEKINTERDTLSKLQETLKLKEFENKNLGCIVKELENDKCELQQKISENEVSLEEIQTSLEHELSNSLKVLDQKETMLVEANNKIEELRSDKRNLEADMTKKQETLQELGVKIINLESALQNATCDLSKERRETSNLNQQVANSNAIIQDLSRKLLEDSDINAALNQELCQTQLALDERESKITDLIARIDKLESQKGKLEAEVAENLVRIEELATEFRETLAQEYEHQKDLQKGLSDAQAIIAEKERDMAESLKKMDLLESQKSKQEADVAEKQTTIQKLEIELGNTKVSLDASQLQLTQAREEISALDKRANDSDESAHNLNDKLMSLSEIKSSLEHELSITLKVMDQKETMLGEANNKIEELHSVKRNLEVDMTKKQETIQELGVKVIDLESALQNATCDLSEARQEVSNLNQQVANSNVIIQDLRGKLLEESDIKAALESKITDFIGRIDKLESQKGKLEAEVAANLGRIEELTSEFRETLAQEHEHQKGLQKEVSDAQAIIAEKERDIAELIVKIDLLESQMSKLEAEAAEKQTAIQKLEIELGNTKVSLDASQLQLTQAREEISALDKRANDSDESAHSLNDKLMSLSEIKTSLEHELSITLEVMDQKETMLREANNEIEELHSGKRNLEADMAKKQETIQELGVKIINLESALQNATCDLSEVRQEISNLNEQVASSNVIIQELRGKLLEESDIKSALESSITNFIARIDKLESQKDRLEAEVVEKQVRIEELTTELGNAKEKISAEWDTALSKLQETLKLKEFENENLGCIVKELENEKCELRQKISENEVSLEEMKIDLGNLNKRLDNTSMDLDIKNETILMMEARISSLTPKINLLESAIIEKDEIIATIQRELLASDVALRDSQDRLDTRTAETWEILKQKEAEIVDLKKENESTCQRVTKMAEELVQVSQTLNAEKSTLLERTKDLELLLARLTDSEKFLQEKLVDKSNDIERYEHELSILQNSMKSTNSVNQQLEKEVIALTESKKQEVSRLEEQLATMEAKTKSYEARLNETSEKIRAEYELKLERIKGKMKEISNERVATARAEERSLLEKEFTKKVKMLQDELAREKMNRRTVEAKLHELSDQLLIAQEDKRTLVSSHVFRQPLPIGGAMSNPAYESPPLMRAHSLSTLPTSNRGLDNYGADFHSDCSSSRRTSTSSRSSHVPKGIGKIFPAAEEEGEVFDNRYLADLKAGVVDLPGSGADRLSILQQRNSMCPPHLKSSYPVESQYFGAGPREDEIKALNKEDKENLPETQPRVRAPGTPSKIRMLFGSGRRN